MVLSSLVALFVVAQGVVGVRGDITIPADASGASGSILVANPTAKPVSLDFAGELAGFSSATISASATKLKIGAKSTVPLKLEITDASFFGTLNFPLRQGPMPLEVRLHRGLVIPPQALSLSILQRSFFSVENPGDAVVSARWLLRSASGDLCAALDCSQIENWFPFKVGPRAVYRIPVAPKEWWFAGQQGQTSVVLNYTGRANGPEQVVPLAFSFVRPTWSDSLSIRFNALFVQIAPLGRLLLTFIWLSVGALAFWFADVILGNVQQYTSLSRQINDFRSRISALSGASASRTRASLRDTCDTLAGKAKGKLMSPDGLQQISLGIEAFERRIRLAEQLDDAYLKRNELLASKQWPMSLKVGVAASLSEVEGFVNGDVSVEDLARAGRTLAKALELDGAAKLLGASFRERLALVQADFARSPWKEFFSAHAERFRVAEQLLPILLDQQDKAKILDIDPVERDIDLTQLEIFRDLATVDPPEEQVRLIVDQTALRSEKSLLRARSLLNQWKEQIFAEDFYQALRNKEWYAYCEPDAVILGSAIKLWIRFSREALNLCAAREEFDCFWNLPDGTFEKGWESYVVASSLGELAVTPSFLQVASAKPREITKVQTPGELEETDIQAVVAKVVWRATRGNWKYDMLQMATSLLVPLTTVALSNFESRSDLGIGPLVTLGFTSQLIQSKLLRKETDAKP